MISLLRNRHLKIFCLGELRANRDALLACEDAAPPFPAPYLCSGAFCHQKADNNSTITTHHHSGVGWGRKAEQRDHWNGEQGEKQLGGAMSYGAWLIILHPLGKVCCNQHVEQSSGGRGKPQGLQPRSQDSTSPRQTPPGHFSLAVLGVHTREGMVSSSCCVCK